MEFVRSMSRCRLSIGDIVATGVDYLLPCHVQPMYSVSTALKKWTHKVAGQAQSRACNLAASFEIHDGTREKPTRQGTGDRTLWSWGRGPCL
jgi:hypothetical protein